MRNDLLGRVFGSLTVVALAGRRDSHLAWECLCSCGVRVVYPGSELTRKGGRVRCGDCFRATLKRDPLKLFVKTSWGGMNMRAENGAYRKVTAIDRVDKTRGYELSNMQVIELVENMRKDKTVFRDGMGRCYRCKETKPMAEFVRCSRSYVQRTSICLPCERARTSARKLKSQACSGVR